MGATSSRHTRARPRRISGSTTAAAQRQRRSLAIKAKQAKKGGAFLCQTPAAARSDADRIKTAEEHPPVGRDQEDLDNEQVAHIFPLPHEDPSELDRLQSLHYMFRNTWQGDNFRAPGVHELLEKGSAKALDIGCGPGLWVLELASAYPRSEFTGLDISPVFPTAIKPSNASFRLCDVLCGPLPFDDNTFDLVHMRDMGAWLSREGWPMVVKEIVRVTKRGGWVEIAEVEAAVTCAGPVTEQVVNQGLIEALKSANFDTSTTLATRLKNYPSLLQPRLTDLTTMSVTLPLGSRGDDCDRYDIVSLVRGFRPSVLRALGVSQGEYEAMCAQLAAEVNAGMGRVRIIRCCARKGGDDRHAWFGDA